MTETRLDVLAIGDAIVDVIATADDEFLREEGLVKGSMQVLDAEGAAGLIAGGGVLLDGRVEARYRGEVEPVDPVAGHIPGARSAPTGDNVDASGRFLDAQQLRKRFAGFGVEPGRAVGAYCGSGVTAAQEVLALHLAGVPAALYAGSWSEWVADPERPVERS